MSYPNILEKFNEYLPLSGGTMTGRIQKNGFLAQNIVDDNLLVIRGGTDATSAFLGLCGKNHSNKGMAYFCATDGTNTTNFCVLPEGYATLAGSKVITSAGGTLTGTITTSNTVGLVGSGNYMDVGYRYSDNNGAIMAFRSSSYTNNPGGFDIFARNGTNTYTLNGRADTGNLSWGGKKVVCVTSYRSGTLWYRLFNDGFIEQGGTDTRTTASDVTISFPKAFTSTNIQVVTGSHTGYSVVRSKTKTTFVLGRNTANTTYWYACGY